MKTFKIFNEDNYQRACRAKITEMYPDKEGRKIVMLDQTIFYAKSGGQPGDIGTIIGPKGEEQVVDTRYVSDEKTHIEHILQSHTQLEVGDEVTCKIDWGYRYFNMRMHSLIHIIGMLFEQKYGVQNCIGSNISEKGRIDYEFFGEIDINWLTKEAQRLIDEGHEIITKGEENNEVKRIWYMDSLGDMPCGGTHPKNSNEIGRISLKRKGLGKQGQRIYCFIEENSPNHPAHS